MNKIILYSAAAIFLLGLVLRIFYALFFPEKFAEGAQKVLFLDERKKALFPGQEDDKKRMVEEETELPEYDIFSYK